MPGSSASEEVGRPRVLHVIDQLELLGGAETSLLALLPRLVAGDQRHGVVVLGGKVRDGNALAAAGVEVFDGGVGGSRSANIRTVAAAVSRFEPDLIHSTLFESDLAARLVGAGRRIPVLTSVVNAAYGAEARAAEHTAGWKLRTVRAIDRMLARRLTVHAHVISEAARAHAVHHLKIAPEITTLIPRGRDARTVGVRTKDRRAEVRRRLGWADDAEVLLNVAREEPQKDQLALVGAFERVARQRGRCLLVLAGRRGRASNDIDVAVAYARAGKRIVRLGVRSDIPDLLAAADLFVFSSRYEGLGGAVVEAAALELPVVTTDVPAVLEVVGQDYPWTVPVGDPTALAQCIEFALASPSADRIAVGAQLRRRFEERFELTPVVDATARLYEHLYACTRSHRSWSDAVRGRQVRAAGSSM
jgi:glycosyltransferase involved in cell wall biosynthesis